MKLKKLNVKGIDYSNMTPIIVLFALCVVMSFLSPVFLSYANLVNVLQQVTVNAVLALGMSVVIFTGGIDLSVGAVLAFGGVVLGKLSVNGGAPAFLASLCALAIGVAFGVINGILSRSAVIQCREPRRVRAFPEDHDGTGCRGDYELLRVCGSRGTPQKIGT